MSTKDLIESAVEHLRTSASVKTVYGDPVVIDGKTIIPVARVAFGFGGGSGTRKLPENGDGEGTTDQVGEGAGGGMAAKPVGVVEISGEETKFVPFGQARKFAIAGLIGSGVGLLLGMMLHRKVTNARN
jgi:uncharacterized spore protein YtfJ